MIHRHSHGQAPSEQCKATHPVCVTLQPLGPLSPQTASTTQTASLLQHSGVDPHSSGPTLLISSATFSYADACNQLFLPPPHTSSSPLSICKSSPLRFLLTFEAACWGNRAGSMFTDTAGISIQHHASGLVIKAKKLDLAEGD